MKLATTFPFRDTFEQFLQYYADCSTYWYIPKARALNEDNIATISAILTVIFEDFIDRQWTRQTQDELLNRLVDRKILDPYRPDNSIEDRTALVRITKILLQTLGLLWIRESGEIVITDAGLELIVSDKDGLYRVIEAQIAKLQYPNPGFNVPYVADFAGILPHLFLLQVIQLCDYYVTTDEYELFVNLAQTQEDLRRIVSYIRFWRDLNDEQQNVVKQIVVDIPMRQYEPNLPLFADQKRVSKTNTRFKRISQNSSYQRSFFSFPRYLTLNENQITCVAPETIDQLIKEQLQDLKIPRFDTLDAWFAYFGDPSQKPSWFTYLSLEIEKASTTAEVQDLVEANQGRLTEEEAETIRRKQIEKDIETFYVANLELLEPGLTLVPNGRQYSTPIGRIDLLCRSAQGEYVVIEVKAEEAKDSVFGQILRYIGWVHRNLADGNQNVRGIILAQEFPQTALYSRIGLLRPDYKQFIQFKRHGLNVSDS